MEQEQESFALQYHDCTKVNGKLSYISYINILMLICVSNIYSLSFPAMLQQFANTNNAPTPENIQKLQRQKEMMEQALNSKVTSLVQLRLTLSEKLKETYMLLTQLQTHVLDEELIRWKREQQLNGNGASFNSNLDTIQEW